MTQQQDPTELIQQYAQSFADVVTGTSCSQTSFSVGKGKFLFLGPGPKGKGYKAMFKLSESLPQLQSMAETEPKRFEVGKTGWITVRFSDEDPISMDHWRKWLAESYAKTKGAG